jgi:hypothetical protein
VRFDLTLKGFDGRKVEIRWSLYSNGRPVPRPWLKDHPVLTVTGERDEEKVSPEFWVPMPKTRAQYYVRIEVFDEHNTKLTHQKTEPFR